MLAKALEFLMAFGFEEVYVSCESTNIASKKTILTNGGEYVETKSVVGSNVEPYTVVEGNPARVLRNRFDDELINWMLRLKWWDRSIEEINNLIPVLTRSDLEKVREELKARL